MLNHYSNVICICIPVLLYFFWLIFALSDEQLVFRDLIASVEWLQNTLHGRGWCGENTLVQNADSQYFIYIGVMGTLAVWCWCRTRQVGSRARSCVDAGKTGGHNFQSRFNRHHRHHSITSYYYSLTAINIKFMLENDTHFKYHTNYPKIGSRNRDLLNTQ